MMEFLQAIEQSRLAMSIKESGTAYTTFLAFHTIGLAFLVGISVATALRILGIARVLPLAPLEDFFPLMYVGFWTNALTGVVLLALYPTKFFVDPVIYIKLGAIAVAMIALRRMRALAFGGRAGAAVAPGEREARGWAIAMLAAWMVAITAGRVTAYGLPTRLQTAAAIVVALAVLILGGYIGARAFGWVAPPARKRVTMHAP